MQSLNDQKMAQFHDQLIDVAICLCGSDRCGYSLLNSFTYSTRYLEEPGAVIWQEIVTELHEAPPSLWASILDTWQLKLHSDGFGLFVQGLQTYRNPPTNAYISLIAAMEPYLDILWTSYSPHTKPDSVKFEDAYRWMRELGHEDPAIRAYATAQFDRMEHHAVAYLSGIVDGAAHDREASLTILNRYDTPLARHIIPHLR
jgi:hypothetical protein